MSKSSKVTLFILLISFFGCSSKESKNDLAKEKLLGNVKSVKETFFPRPVEKFGEMENGEPAVSSQTLYNKEGNKTEQNIFSANGNLSRRILYKYEGQQISESNEYLSNGSLTSKVVYKYDKEMHPIESYEYAADGSLNYKWQNKIDQSGNVIESSRYNPDGSVSVKWIYKYDKNGNVLEETLYEADGILSSQEIYKYDKKGFKIEQITNSTKGGSWKVTFTNDKLGNITEVTFYNQNGVSDPSNKKVYKYEYDNCNNWTKQFFYFGKIMSITTRQIEYF